MKLTKIQKFVFISIAVVIVLLVGAFAAISITSYKPTVVFYNVNEKIQAAVTKELEGIAPAKTKNKSSKKSSRYNYIVLDESIPLSKQKKAKKAKMVFATLDYDIKEFATTSKKVKPQNISLLNDTPSTTKQVAITKGNNLFVVPLLYDLYELDVNRIVFNDSAVKGISIWSDLEDFFEDTWTQDNSPFVFAGRDDKTLIDFVGSIVEALNGTDALLEAEQKIYDAAKKENEAYLEKTISELCAEGQPLYDAVQKISELSKSKYLHQAYLNSQPKDTLFFMENHLSNTSFLKLSEHRNVDPKVINEFSSIFIPGKDEYSPRTFSAPTIVALSFSKDKTTTEAITLLATSRQANLSYATGLAPIQANCATPDRQADDVRFWLAASSGPNMPLATAIPSGEMRKVAAEYIRATIRGF